MLCSKSTYTHMFSRILPFLVQFSSLQSAFRSRGQTVYSTTSTRANQCYTSDVLRKLQAYFAHGTQEELFHQWHWIFYRKNILIVIRGSCQTSVPFKLVIILCSEYFEGYLTLMHGSEYSSHPDLGQLWAFERVISSCCCNRRKPNN